MSARLMNRTERLAAIEQLLFRSTMGLRAVEIAEACGVDRRTIYRDLALLGDIGVPLYQKDGRFCIDRQHYAATIRLNFDETVALFLAARLASRHARQRNPHTLTALNKLGMALPMPIASHIEVAAEQAGGYPVHFRAISVLETLARAWGERRKVKLWCKGSDGGKPRIREFATYFIEPAPNGTVYAIGFDSLTQRVRAFKLSRIRRARMLTSTYHLPSQFDARHYLGGNWSALNGEYGERHTVVLIFSADAARHMAGRYGQIPQKIDVLDDERVRLSLRVGDWRELLPWVRSWGAQVEVLEPAALRDELAREAAQVRMLYDVATT